MGEIPLQVSLGPETDRRGSLNVSAAVVWSRQGLYRAGDETGQGLYKE